MQSVVSNLYTGQLVVNILVKHGCNLNLCFWMSRALGFRLYDKVNHCALYCKPAHLYMADVCMPWNSVLSLKKMFYGVRHGGVHALMFAVYVQCVSKQEAQLSQTDDAALRVIEY